MLIASLAILATLLPALASTHQPPPVLRHRRLAESANHQARSLTALPAERANLAHADAHRAIKKAIRKRDGQTCRPKPSASASPSPAAEPAASSSPSPAAIDNQQAWAQQVGPSAKTMLTLQASASPSPSATSNNNWSNNGNSASASASASAGISVNVNVGGLLQLNTG